MKKTVFLSLLLVFSGKLYAYGALGHQVIAALAQDMLTPKARAQVEAMLADEDAYESNRDMHRADKPLAGLAKISVWADDIRASRPETRAWHYVNIQIGEPGYDPAKIDSPNVVTALERQLAILRKPDADRRAREEALKWVVHLVGDLHQPLHVGEDHDKGGNEDKVMVGRHPYNLHEVWDYVLLERLHLDPDSLRAMLAREIAADPDFIARNARGTVRDWVDEEHAKSRACYLLRGKPMRKGVAVSLDRAYIRGATLTILDQLEIAGVRLAFALNAALDPAGPGIPVAESKSTGETRRSGPGGRDTRAAFFAHADSTPESGESVEGKAAVKSAPTVSGRDRARLSGKPHGGFAWSANSRVYHYADCADVARIKTENLRTGDIPPPDKKLHQGCPRSP